MEFESWRRSTPAIKRPPPDAVYTPIDGTSHANALLSAPLVQMALKAAQTHAELEASMKHLSAIVNSPAIQMDQKFAQEQADLKASLRHMLGKGEEEPT
jgi:hypothetical protein